MSVKRLKRLRAVEELYLQGYKPQEVFDQIGKDHRVVIGTIRNDFQDIRDIWGQDLKKLFSLQGGEMYLASIQQVRRLALADKEYGVVLKIDQEIAKMAGVASLVDPKKIHLTVDAARGYIDNVMEVIMANVIDSTIRQSIIEGIAALDDEP